MNGGSVGVNVVRVFVLFRHANVPLALSPAGTGRTDRDVVVIFELQG